MFFSFEFWLGLGVFVIIYAFASVRVQNILLLLSGLFFLYFYDTLSFWTWLFSIVLTLTGVRFFLQDKSDGKARLLICILIVALLTVQRLYLKNFIENPERVVGLSYFSLAMIGLILESYWKRPSSQLETFPLLVASSFFPIISMGPIEKLNAFQNQFKKRRIVSVNDLSLACVNILFGFFKIFCVAAPLKLFINHSNPLTYSLAGVPLLLYCFFSFVQLYCEFSGYIAIVTGLSGVLGIKITANFNNPYLARNIRDLWKRWHISFVNWVRDYIYFPILMKTRNQIFTLFCVIFFVGSWHGLSFGYLYWSLYWSFLVGVYILALRLSKYKLLGQIMKIKGLGIFATIIAMSLSNISFMAEVQGLGSTLSRTVRLNDYNFTYFWRDDLLTQAELIFLYLSICIVLFFEVEVRVYSTIKALVFSLIFLFLISVLGRFNGYEFIYMRL
ncbi:MAG: hypothetical protein HUU57_00945 [Bdellovibrio sp.]|nr:hypothetical protein [Bdellovibrio sp.]